MREPDLYQPSLTRAVIGKYNFDIQKKYGQNFLIDGRVLNKIVDAADISKDDFVIEIGPGIGTLTQFLSYNARKVCCIEIDKKLMEILEWTLADFENVEIINNDILKVDLNELVKEKNEGRPIKVVANLPYYITTPIIMGILEQDVPVTSMTFMVQKEVAQRMSAVPGTKEYGALSLAVQYYAKPYLAANVPENCFFPRPNVGSAVICLKKYEKPPVEVIDKGLMFRLIHAGFEQRRKTLVNALSNTAGLGISKADISSVIEEVCGNANIRGEALNLQQFALMSDCFGRLLD